MSEGQEFFKVTPFRSVAAVENGHAYEDYAASIGEPNAASGVKMPLEVIRVSTLAGREPPSRPWLVKDMIPDWNVTLLIGDGGTGKSLLAQQLAVAVAAGSEWIGTLPEVGTVLYLSAEDDVDEVHRRLKDITAAANLTFEQLQDLHLVPLAGKDAILALPEGRSDRLATTPLWASIVELVQEIRPRLVVVDNLADAFAGQENIRTQARQFIGILRGLAIENRLAVVLLSHPSVTGMTSGTGTSGSTAWSNSVRSRFYLERAKIDDGDEPDPDLRILRLMKANHAAVGAEIRMRWDKGRFKLESGAPGAFDRLGMDQRAERVFLALLDRLMSEGRFVSHKRSPTYAPVIFAKQPDREGCGKDVFERAMERLMADKQIRVESYGSPSRSYSRIVRNEA